MRNTCAYDDSADGAIMLNNAEWLDGLNYLDFLRDVGPAFLRQPDAELREA